MIILRVTDVIIHPSNKQFSREVGHPIVFLLLTGSPSDNENALCDIHNLSMKTRLTHWGRVTHICVVKLTIIGSDNGLSPGRRQAIMWTNDGILLIGPLGTNFSEILIGIQTFSFKKMLLKMSSAIWRPFCLGLNVLNTRLKADMKTCLQPLIRPSKSTCNIRLGKWYSYTNVYITDNICIWICLTLIVLN